MKVMIKVDWIHRGLRRIVCLSEVLLILLALCFPKECWASFDGGDGFFMASHRYYVKMEDFTSRSGSTYVYESFRHTNDLLYYLSTSSELDSYPGFKLTLKGANVDLGYLFSSRWTLSDNITFPNGGQIIVEWPAYSPSDYSQLCFSFFSAYLSAGGNLVKDLPGVSFEANETDPNSGYMLVYSSHHDENGNYIDQTGSITINIPAGVKFGTNLYTNGINISMGYPQKVVVRNNAEYWWESETTGELMGRDLEYSGAEQKLLKPHSSFAASAGIFWFDGSASYQNFHYRWRKTDHDGSNPTAWSEWSQEEPAATEVGRYEIQYYVQTNIQGMYGEPGSQEAGENMEQPIVSRILRTLTDINDPVALSPMYNFHTQPLITAGTSSQGVYMYKSVIVAEEEGEEVEYVQQNWSATVPTATEVGNYRVYWYIAGDATRFYKDSGNTFEPKGSTDVTIVPLDLATTTMTVTDNNHTYDGLPHTVSVDVKCGDETVDFNCYAITYGPEKTDVNETETGDYDVTITAKDGYPNFTGTQTRGTLSIGKFNLAQSIGNLQPRLYTSQPILPAMDELPELKLTDNTTVITQDNFEITAYGENTNAGTGTVTITAKDGSNYSGSRILEFAINKREVTVTANAQSIVYNTENQFHNSGTDYATLALISAYDDGYSLATVGHTLKSVILTSEETDRGVGTYSNSIIPANAKIKDGSGADVTSNYTITYAAATLTITQKNFSSGELTVSDIQDEYAYTGAALTPLPKVRDKGKPLSSADYDLAYSDNTAVGAATLTVTFKNNYVGSTSRTFEIYYAVDAYERTGDANLYRTYYNNIEDLEIRDNTKFGIYKGSLSTDKTKVVLTDAGTVIPAATAVMLVGTETPIKLYKATGTAGDFAGNILQGGGTHTATLDGSEHYYIFNGDCFIWATEGTMDAAKAFFDGSTQNLARSLAIVFGDDDTTGINGNELHESGSDKWYDLMGNRIDKPTRKGLYIKNGHKIVVK